MFKFIAGDTETKRIAPGRVIPPMVCASFCEPQQEPTLHHVRDGAAELFLKYLADPAYLVVGHNMPYDLAVAVDAAQDKEAALWTVANALESGRVRDCLIRQKIFHIRKGDLQNLRKGILGLHDLSKLFLREEMAKGEDTWRLRYGELIDVPLNDWPYDAVKYAKLDAKQTIRVFLAQQELFEKMRYVGKEPYSCPDEVFQLKAAFVLQLLSAWGIRTNPLKVERLEHQLLCELEAYTRVLKQAHIIRGNDTQDMGMLRKYIEEAFEKAGKQIPATKGGDVSTSKATIELVKDIDTTKVKVVQHDDNGEPFEKEVPLLTAVHERKHVEKILKTFLAPAKLGTVQPLTASFNVLLASTRTSCSGGKLDGKPNGTNLQNVPKKAGVRECFEPRKGFVYCDADYTTLEMRTFAQILYELKQPDILRQALIADKDPHVMVGCQLLGISYDEFVARRKAGDRQVEEIRDLSKPGNFGYMGGQGAKRFKEYVKQFGIDISLEMSTKIKNSWAATWRPQGYFQWINSLINEDTGFGNVVLSSGVIRGMCRYTVACNTPFQSRAAYGAKEAMWQLFKEMYLIRSSDLYGSRMVNFVHDEFLNEVPEEHAHPAAMRIKQIMEESMMVWTPNVPQKVSPVLMRWWDKKAKPIVDDEGNLIPYGDDQESV